MSHTPFPTGPSQSSPFPSGSGSSPQTFGPPSYGAPRPSLPQGIPQPVKPSKLGVVGFWVSIGALVIGLISCVIGLVFLANHNHDGANGAWIGAIPASLIGLVGLVVSVIAMLNPASRKWGLIGTVTAVAAPIIVFGIWLTATWAINGG